MESISYIEMESWAFDFAIGGYYHPDIEIEFILKFWMVK